VCGCSVACTPRKPAGLYGLQGCCEDCRDSEGKMRGMQGNTRENAKGGLYKKIRELAAFARRCQSPLVGIRNPPLYPPELTGAQTSSKPYEAPQSPVLSPVVKYRWDFLNTWTEISQQKLNHFRYHKGDGLKGSPLLGWRPYPLSSHFSLPR
jgi:hypothetical protein